MCEPLDVQSGRSICRSLTVMVGKLGCQVSVAPGIKVYELCPALIGRLHNSHFTHHAPHTAWHQFGAT
jgi:hypothetical protein